MITGYISEEGFLGWMQGFSVLVGLAILIGFGTVNDYIKDKQFVKLQEWQQKGKIGVIRGKKGVTQTVSVYKIVVGDVIVLEPGCIIPADCLLIEGNDIEVDESPLTKREGLPHVKKSVASDKSFRDADPFLFSGSILLKGTGKALVCVVGKASNRPEMIFDTKSKTPLQERLQDLANVFKKYAIYASCLILAASVVNFIVKLFITEDYSGGNILNDIVLYVKQFITIVIVVIPEGLPLVISLSLAYSVTYMKNDGLLIK